MFAKLNFLALVLAVGGTFLAPVNADIIVS